MQTIIKMSSSAPSSPRPHSRRELINEMQQQQQSSSPRRSRLVFASPRLQQDDGDLFPTKSNLQEHEDRWNYIGEQAGSHRQESHVLRVNRNVTPKALQHGTPRQAAARITELHLCIILADSLPEWLDAVGQTFFHLEHLYLRYTTTDDDDDDIETKTPHSVKRLYILYRLPRLKSINGVNVTFAERALARPNNPNGRRVKREDWMDSSSLLDFVDDEVEYTADDSDDDEDRKTSIGIEVDLCSDASSSSVTSETDENVKLLKAVKDVQDAVVNAVDSNLTEVDFSSTACIAEERNDAAAMLEESLPFNRPDGDREVEEKKEETTEETRAESNQVATTDTNEETDKYVPSPPSPPSKKGEAETKQYHTGEEKGHRIREERVSIEEVNDETSSDEDVPISPPPPPPKREEKTSQHRTREERVDEKQVWEERAQAKEKTTRHRTREDRTARYRSSALLPRGKRSGGVYLPLLPPDEKSEYEKGESHTCLPSLPEQLRRDFDCLEYVEAESSAACEWSAACGTLSLFRSKATKDTSGASKPKLRLSFRRKDAKNETAKRDATVDPDFKPRSSLDDELRMLLGHHLEPPPSMSPLYSSPAEKASPTRVEKLLDSVWTPPKGQKVSPISNKDLAQSPPQVTSLDPDGIPPAPNHSISPRTSPRMSPGRNSPSSQSLNRHVSIVDQEEGTEALAPNYSMQPRMSPGKTSPVPCLSGNVSPSPSPQPRVPASKSLSSPFPMQFRQRATSSPKRELSVSTKFNLKDGPMGPAPPPIPRARSPSLATMETIEAPLPLNRVQSSPSKLAGRRSLQSQKHREDLPPPCPGGPRRVPAAPTGKRKKKGKARRWREQLSARSTSIIDGEDTDDSAEASDEENVATQG